jgi:hypothetical protein
VGQYGSQADLISPLDLVFSRLSPLSCYAMEASSRYVRTRSLLVVVLSYLAFITQNIIFGACFSFWRTLHAAHDDFEALSMPYVA